MRRIAVRVLFVSVLLLPFSAVAQEQVVWYVAFTGNDATCDGSAVCPFQTIQRAIDAASDGDTVVVMEGRYTGPGNVNLNFAGKAIAVQSRDPEDEACVRATILDAQGRGTIARFVGDEGPGSVLAGFSLIGGDRSSTGRGVPGYFEFSDHARPTTRNLRLAGGDPSNSAASILPAEVSSSWEGRIWDGNNPFHQPAQTTDYYGSGDVDGDGRLTSADVSLAQEMADGLTAVSPRADVDGNTLVEARDVALIGDALGGADLPGWWNSLTGPAERMAWVEKMLAVDPTDKHPYAYWFQCLHFAAQTFIHSAGYRGDLFHTRYDGGQTRFNVPMYYASVANSSYGHAINALLIGDNPLDFDDWRFFEPQTDYAVYPGMWDMPYDTTVRVSAVGSISVGGLNSSPKVSFYVEQTGWSLSEYSPDLILARPDPKVEPPDNRPDLWNPRFVPSGEGHILYDRLRDDLSRMTDVYLGDRTAVGRPNGGVPLMQSAQYSRLLDVYQAPDGTVHLLWVGKPDYTPGVFHGTLDLVENQVNDVTRVSTGARMVREGRVRGTVGGDIHVFWLEVATNIRHPYSTGVYWARRTEAGWQSAQNLTEGVYLSGGASLLGLSDPDHMRYTFDVVALDERDVHLVWVEYSDWSGEDPTAAVHHRHFDGAWGDATIVASTSDWYNYPLGVDLASDSAGALHLVYWTGYTSALWGNLTHQTYDGSAWSPPESVDTSGNAGYPRLAAGSGETMYLAWSNRGSSQIVPIWSQYIDGRWQAEQTLSIQPGTNAWYPMTEFLADGSLLIAWSAQHSDLVTIETTEIRLYGLSLEPSTSLRSGDPGETVTHTLYLSNTSTTTDTWDVAVEGGVWPVSAPGTVGPLASGDGIDLELSVAIPPDAPGGSVDATTVTLTSQGAPAQWDTATLTTTANFVLFLPFVVAR